MVCRECCEIGNRKKKSSCIGERFCPTLPLCKFDVHMIKRDPRIIPMHRDSFLDEVRIKASTPTIKSPCIAKRLYLRKAPKDLKLLSYLVNTEILGIVCVNIIR